MRAIIPIAGEGTRLRPHTQKRQKALLPVGGTPVLDHVLTPLREAGVKRVSLVIGCLGDQVREHMLRYDDLQVTFIEQPQQLGLGEAVFLALKDEDEPIVIVLADTIFKMDHVKFIREGGNLIGVVEVEDPRRFGVVETVGRRIVGLVEKPEVPRSNLAIAGIYRIESQKGLRHILSTLIENEVKTRGEYQLTDALNMMVEQGARFRTFPIEGWLDCGTEETLLETNGILLEEAGGEFIHPDATVDRCTLRSSSIMEQCIVKESILENCIVLPRARVEKCYIRNEIIEEEAELKGYLSGG
ncbi:MAG: NTP transferase domain-containing protein [Fidelibacterota bacterium]|nr:MAG: NTP transferase domain-containing protein [Candidatus Neomarinimicrobiota bacterium]